jgi:hypothetical protein
MNVFDITEEWQFKSYGEGLIFLIHTPTEKVAAFWAVGKYTSKQERVIRRFKNTLNDGLGFRFASLIESFKKVGFTFEEF